MGGQEWSKVEKQDNSPENHPGIFLAARKERFNSNGHQRVVHASVNRSGHQQLEHRPQYLEDMDTSMALVFRIFWPRIPAMR